MGFKYKVEPVEESFGMFLLGVVLAPWVFLIAAFTIVDIITIINKWRDALKTPWERLKDKAAEMEKKGKWYDFYYPHDTFFPEAEPIKPNAEGGEYFSPNPTKRPPKLTIDGVIPYSEFHNFIIKLAKCISDAAKMSSTDDCAKRINATISSTFKKSELLYNKSGEKLIGFNLKKTSATWPKDDWYKNLDAHLKAISHDTLPVIRVSFSKLSEIVKQVVNAPYNEKDTSAANKKELAERVAFVETCMIYCDLYEYLSNAWDDNLAKLSTVDVVYWHKKDDFEECGSY